MTTVEATRLPRATRQIVESCYPKTDYAYVGHGLLGEKVRAYGSDRLVVSYEHEGVSDVRVAFVVEGRGRIVSAFQYGM